MGYASGWRNSRFRVRLDWMHSSVKNAIQAEFRSEIDEFITNANQLPLYKERAREMKRTVK